MTPEGLELIDATLARLRQERALAQGTNDRAAQARIARDLHYWTSRHSTARVVRAPKDAAVVRFGCTVTIARDDERRESYRIVGEDEADPSRGDALLRLARSAGADGEAGRRCWCAWEAPKRKSSRSNLLGEPAHSAPTQRARPLRC